MILIGGSDKIDNIFIQESGQIYVYFIMGLNLVVVYR